MNTLKDIITNLNLSTDKNSIHSYVDYYYEHSFSGYREKPITIIEVGVCYGGSIELYNEYFTDAKIYGIDNTERYYTKEFLDKMSTMNNVTLITENAYDISTVEKLPNMDIFIDDGTHNISDQIFCLQQYLPKVNNNGLFIIEDVQRPEHFRELYNAMSEEYKKYAIPLDFSSIKNRYDDRLFVVKLP